MKIQITYCSVWNYEPRAAGLADLIKRETGLKAQLVPGSGGIYDVTADGAMVFSKKEAGGFPENRDVVDKLKTLAGP